MSFDQLRSSKHPGTLTRVPMERMFVNIMLNAEPFIW